MNQAVISNKPYLIRALHEWCSDSGYTPYVSVFVDEQVQVPMEYVQKQEIVLNMAWEATQDLHLGNEYISFSARFGGVAQSIMLPISHVLGVFAKENGQGMAFHFQPADAPKSAAETRRNPQANAPVSRESQSDETNHAAVPAQDGAQVLRPDFKKPK